MGKKRGGGGGARRGRVRGRKGEGNVCLRWALWRGMQQERLPAWQTLVFGLHFPDTWAVPTVSAVTASSHACSNQKLFPFLLLPSLQASCTVGDAGTEGIRCSSRAWCWAVEARSYRVMDVLLHRGCIVDKLLHSGHIVDELLQGGRRVICNVIHMGVIDLHELLKQLRRGLGSCDDRNLERLQWRRCHGVPLHKVCPLHVHVMECCRLGELGRRSVHVDGPLGVVCAVGLHILGDGNLSRKGVGWRWKAAGTRWAMDVSIH